VSIIVNTKPARKAPQFMSHAGFEGSGINYSWTHNIEPQTKAVIIPWIGSWFWGLYGVGASVGGVSATQIASTSYNFSGLNYGTFILWVVLNPPTGLQTCGVGISSANNYGVCSGASFTYDKVTGIGTGGITGSQSFSVSGGNNVTVVNSFMKLGGYSGPDFTGFSPNPTWVTANCATGDGFPGASNPTFGLSPAGVYSCWGAYVPLIGEP